MTQEDNSNHRTFAKNMRFLVPLFLAAPLASISASADNEPAKDQMDVLAQAIAAMSSSKIPELRSRFSAFRGRKGGYPHLIIEKIPNSVLSRCEWGRDDYSLRVENLPQAPPKPGQMELI